MPVAEWNPGMVAVENYPDLTQLSEGELSPQLIIEELNRTDIIRYAGAAGDFNRLHHDDKYAEQAGFPSVIAHGMLVAGIGSTVVDDWLGPTQIEEFGTRFKKPVFPGDTLIARATVTNLVEDEEKVEADLEIWNQDDGVVLTGWIVASPSM